MTETPNERAPRTRVIASVAIFAATAGVVVADALPALAQCSACAALAQQHRADAARERAMQVQGAQHAQAAAVFLQMAANLEAEAQKCMQGLPNRCGGSTSGGRRSGAGAPGMPLPDLAGGAGADGVTDGTPDLGVGATVAPDPNQLLAAFLKRDEQRLASDSAQLDALLRSILQALCQGGQTADGCSSQIGPLLLPPPAAVSELARKPRRPPASGAGTSRRAGGTAGSGVGAGAGASATGPKNPKGCFVRGVVTCKNIYCSPTDALVGIGFTGPSTDTLVITSQSDHEVWVGEGVTPLNMMIPPGGPPLTIPMSVYRSKSDHRPSEVTLGLKYWTTDPNRCATDAVDPGPTTPEEFGPTGGLPDGSPDPTTDLP